MPMLPEDITAPSLRRRWRGYDRHQVDALLDRIGNDYAGALDRIGIQAEDTTRTRSERDELGRRLSTLADTLTDATDAARRAADADAAAIRTRAERAATLIVSQAEDAAAACIRQAEALRADAQADADASRQRLEDADQRANQLEDSARRRWDAVHAETEARFEQLRLAERRFAERIRRVENTLGELRSQVSLLDQVRHVEGVLDGLRADAQRIPASVTENGAGAGDR